MFRLHIVFFRYPFFTKNLSPIHSLISPQPFIIVFDDTKCLVQDLRTKQVMASGSMMNGLYILHVERVSLCNSTLNNISCFGIIIDCTSNSSNKGVNLYLL